MFIGELGQTLTRVRQTIDIQNRKIAGLQSKIDNLNAQINNLQRQYDDCVANVTKNYAKYETGVIENPVTGWFQW